MKQYTDFPIINTYNKKQTYFVLLLFLLLYNFLSKYLPISSFSPSIWQFSIGRTIGCHLFITTNQREHPHKTHSPRAQGGLPSASPPIPGLRAPPACPHDQCN